MVTNRNLISRVLKLETGKPSDGEQEEMRERLERARHRVLMSMPEAYRPQYLAEQAAAHARSAEIHEAARRRGRKLSMAEMIRAARPS